ncbi:hypothetical protein GCM10023144_12550 [Pigmentiphaga soli]|uniref:Lipoprotein n=1 Tax=Pigmentiphaga soli TaxID=1007095 RepID=A0ABP8GNP3_9BURK
MQKKKWQMAAGILALSMLAACGGDGDDSGTQGDGGGTPDGEPAAPYTAEQVKWYGHESAFTALSISRVGLLLTSVALETAGTNPSGPQACPGGGTFTAAVDDADSNEDLSAGDSVTLNFAGCFLPDDMQADGQVKVTLTELNGQFADETDAFDAHAELVLTNLLLDGETTVNGTLAMVLAHDTKDTPDTTDDTDTVTTHAGSLALTEPDSDYTNQITGYESEIVFDYATQGITFTKADYTAKGSGDPILGQFDYKVSLDPSVIVDAEFIPSSGKVKAVTATETITTTFATEDDGTSVTVTSSSGTTSTMSLEEFDDL